MSTAILIVLAIATFATILLFKQQQHSERKWFAFREVYDAAEISIRTSVGSDVDKSVDWKRLRELSYSAYTDEMLNKLDREADIRTQERLMYKPPQFPLLVSMLHHAYGYLESTDSNRDSVVYKAYGDLTVTFNRHQGIVLIWGNQRSKRAPYITTEEELLTVIKAFTGQTKL